LCVVGRVAFEDLLNCEVFKIYFYLIEPAARPCE